MHKLCDIVRRHTFTPDTMPDKCPVKYSFQTNLQGATTAALHDIADVFRLNARSNEWLYIVMVQLFQLQVRSHQKDARNVQDM